MINTLISHQTEHSQIIPDLELWILNITFLNKLDYAEQSAFFFYFSFLFCNHVSIQSHFYLNIQVMESNLFCRCQARFYSALNHVSYILHLAMPLTPGKVMCFKFM